MRHLALIATLSLALPATATSLVNSESFESPDYAAGALEGQQGWQNFVTGGTTATVQSAVSESGSQAVRIDRAANSDGYWLNLIDDTPTGRFVSIDWDMLVEPITDAGTALGPFFGVMVFDDSSGSVNQLAGFGIDASAEEVIYQQAGTGSIQAAGTATLGVWNHFRIEIDFENDRYRGFVNGAFVAEAGFIDGAAGIDRLTDADLIAVTAANDSASRALEGTAYFDNYLVRDGLRGDYNNDGVVDSEDYTVWRDSQNATGFGLAADGDADGVVNANDYAIWAASYGASNAISGAASAVPEPSALLGALTLSFAGLFPVRRDAAA